MDPADGLEHFASLLAHLEDRLATAMSREEAVRLLSEARGEPGGTDLDPLWDRLETGAPGLFRALADWLHRLLDALPPHLAERLAEEFGPDFDRVLEMAD